MKIEKVAAVVGVGPGLGASVARRFAREGYAVALLARRLDVLRQLHDEIVEAGGRAATVTVDAGAPASVAAAFAEVRDQLGDPEVFVYNAGAFHPGGILDVTPERFEECWRTGCFGAFLCAREVLPGMLQHGRGTILLTGAADSLRGSALLSSLAVGKFGLRALAQSMAREFGAKGVHVAHVVIDGQIDTPQVRAMAPNRAASTLLDPDAIARTYWDLHAQEATAWTLELDLRPATEKF